MKPSSNPKRYRGGRPGNRHRHGLSSNFESNGPDVKVKGSATQVHERYQALSRDALASGDRVAAENYLQHAEHYQRIINAQLAAQAAQAEANGGHRPPRDAAERPHRNGEEGDRRPRRNRQRVPAAAPTAGAPAPAVPAAGAPASAVPAAAAPTAAAPAPDAPQPAVNEAGSPGPVEPTGA